MAIEVRKDDPAQWRDVAEVPRALRPSEVRLRVDRYGLSTNNVTYAHFGDLMHYWQFFPTEDSAWGRVPVWGFADVVESAHPEVAVGERLFGYLPMADELIITAGRVSPRTLHDHSPHRASLPGAYNSFSKCAADPLYRAADEDLLMLLYPLFFTAWTIDDFLADHDDFGAAVTVISSASSKTSLAVAHLLARRGVPLVGLTSAANVAFTTSRGVYDRVLTYDQIGELDQVPTVFVDVAGNAAVVRHVHEHLRSLLAHSMVVGATQFGATDDGEGPLPGPRRAFLFAPAQIDKRTGEWGADELARRVAEAWSTFTPWAREWIDFVDLTSARDCGGAFAALVAGTVAPTVGYRCSVKGN
jgi:Protein of unknown function (DUF2855)